MLGELVTLPDACFFNYEGAPCHGKPLGRPGRTTKAKKIELTPSYLHMKISIVHSVVLKTSPKIFENLDESGFFFFEFYSG